jgi:hypothetical protein
MKNSLAIVFTFIAFAAFAQSEEEAVKNVVNTAYVGGIHNGGPVDDIRKGFHPTFAMLRQMDNTVKPLPIEEWITNIEKTRSSTSGPSKGKTEGRFVSVTVAGTAANVVLELYRSDKKIFTDNLLLYKFSEGWRIVSKTYFRHP